MRQKKKKTKHAKHAKHNKTNIKHKARVPKARAAKKNCG
jgi:hypothetical protein